MNESTFLVIAIFVFSLLVIGLVLTVIEFRRGEPRQQQKEADLENRTSVRRDAGVGTED